MASSALGSGLTTLLQDQEDRKISIKGLNKDGSFPVNPEVPGQSPTTGLPWSDLYMPMLVQIDNDAGGLGKRAPWGAADADIVYETPLHKNGNTRISFLFSDTVPESAGPVRSTRITHVELREEWDAGFLYYGGQPYEGTNVDDKFRETGANKKGVLFSGTAGTNKAWKQYYTRVKGLPGPHNVDANVKAIQGLMPEGFTPPSRPYLFTDALPELGDFATNVSITLKNKEYSSNFVYDSNANVYMRFVNGQPYVDASTGEQLSFSNLIIQRTEVTFYHGRSDSPLTVDIGSGNADIFIGGRYIPGYWIRTGMNQRTVFFDQDGNELQLQRGKTFISMEDYSIPVSYTAE
jgi:hypothetical protein